MLLFEISPPFQWKPKYERAGGVRRFLWGWFAIAHTPHDFNAYIQGIADAAVKLHRQQQPPLRNGKE